MDLGGYKYLFLDKVFKGDSYAEDVCELVLSDERFLKTSVLRCTYSELESIVSSNPGLITDFSFKDGYYLCNNGIKSYPINNLVLEHSGLFEFECDRTNFYYFLCKAVEHGCIILDDSIVSEDAYLGTAFASVSAVKFASTTMSVYVLLRDGTKLFNKPLITLENCNLEFHPFYFAIPCDSNGFTFDGCCFIKNMIINNKQYSVWHADSMRVYDYDNKISFAGALINKANCQRTIRMSLLKVLQYYRDFLFSLTQSSDEDESLVWVGGTSSKKSNYGVIFESTIKKLTTEQVNSLVRLCLFEIVDKYATYDDAKYFIMSSQMDYVSKVCAMVLLPIIYKYGDYPVNALSEVLNTIESIEEDVFYADLYLYRVRATSYLYKKHLVVFPDVFLVGGNEKGTTLVKEGFSWN